LAFLGRISPEKRVDRAIEIATLAGIPLKIAAKVDNADREYFEVKIKPLLNNSLVEFIGEIGYPDKDEFLGKALALLFPINWPEPFGLVMIEAMACGTPVIACPLGSVPEVIEEGRSGFLINDVQAGVRAVEEVSKIRREECRHRFEERFSATRMAHDYLTVYQRLAGKGSEVLHLGDGVSVG
jgi:glycosyltransferase involved in cell wall biosynthesis